jgi:peptidoglycan/xylan/chitin deacetylase (PgdA/CDA1 family)
MLNFKTVNSIMAILLVALVLLKASYWYVVLLLLIWGTLTIIGSFHIRWNYHIKSLHKNYKTAHNHIAITFDDGPHIEFTPQILDVLKHYEAKATFFCIGKHTKNHPELVNRIISEGHIIGNHTFTHSNNFGFFKTEAVLDELRKTNATIQSITGLDVKLFRPPFGVTNPRMKKVLSSIQLQSIGWSIRSLDTTSKTEDSIIRKIQKNLKKGDVVLLHDTSAKSLKILEQLLEFMKEQQLKSVTIPTLFNIKAYA